MNADVFALIIIGIAIFALVFSKTHVAFVTLALCAGFVLSAEVGPSLINLFSNASSDSNAIDTIITLVLLLFPALIIAYRFRKSQKGGGRLIQQIIPAFALSLLLIIFIFDFLPQDAKDYINSETYIYGQINLLRSWIILFAILTAIFDILIQHAGPPRAYNKKKEK